MIQLVLSVLGVMMLCAGLIGSWMAWRALQNEKPHTPTFLVGALLAVAAYWMLALGLVFNGATWFGLAVKAAVVMYAVGLALQKLGRARR